VEIIGLLREEIISLNQRNNDFLIKIQEKLKLMIRDDLDNITEKFRKKFSN
jgi:hypothetical protein